VPVGQDGAIISGHGLSTYKQEVKPLYWVKDSTMHRPVGLEALGPSNSNPFGDIDRARPTANSAERSPQREDMLSRTSNAPAMRRRACATKVGST